MNPVLFHLGFTWLPTNWLFWVKLNSAHPAWQGKRHPFRHPRPTYIIEWAPSRPNTSKHPGRWHSQVASDVKSMDQKLHFSADFWLLQSLPPMTCFQTFFCLSCSCSMKGIENTTMMPCPRAMQVSLAFTVWIYRRQKQQAFHGMWHDDSNVKESQCNRNGINLWSTYLLKITSTLSSLSNAIMSEQWPSMWELVACFFKACQDDASFRFNNFLGLSC